jgi:hypothetical protein
MEQVPNRVISAAVSPDSRSPAREGARGVGGGGGGDSWHGAVAVRVDIQGWLIYGAGETVPLLLVFNREEGPGSIPLTYSIM